MKQLALDVKRLEGQLVRCTSCGMCQAVCPLYEKTRKEADVSRGKLALINGLIDQIFDDPKGVNQHLDRCLLCGSCAKACPSRVNTLEIFIHARVIIRQYLGLPFYKKLLFKKILASPGTFNILMGLAAAFQPFFLKKEDNVQGTSCARFSSPLLKDRRIISLHGAPFYQTLTRQDFRKDTKGIRVAFFVGCLIDKLFPDIAHSLLYILEYFNVRVFIPANQGCCGMPALSAGDQSSFDKLVDYHIDLFSNEKFDYLVTACPTCAAAIIKLWPVLSTGMEISRKKKIEAMAEKTVDISWLMDKRFDLVSAIPETDDEKERTTYHDPCHLKKSLGVSNEPRSVIKATSNTLVEMAKSDTCCGMGGRFNLTHYGLSYQIGQTKTANIIDTHCTTVATSCPACIMQLSEMLAKENQKIMVKHPVEIYASALKADKQ